MRWSAKRLVEGMRKGKEPSVVPSTWYVASPVRVKRAMERKMMEEEDRAEWFS